jgi:hypothetical protein
MTKYILALSLSLFALGCQAPLEVSKTKSTANNGIPRTYMVENIAGWTINVEDTVWLKRPSLTRECLAAIDKSLSKIAATLPPQSLERLRSIPIYLTDTRSVPAPVHTHRDKRWLAAHGEDIEKVNAVDICDPDKIVSYLATKDPGLLLEFSFAYQQLFLTASDQDTLRQIYTSALSEGKYRLVASDRGVRQTPAAYDESQMFVSGSQAYWGRNDFYPFTRAELKEYDPKLHDFLKLVWERD